MPLPHYHTGADTRGRLGQVVPAWFADSVPDADVRRLLHLTLAHAAEWSEPQDIVVVADGQPRVARLAADAAQGLGLGQCRVVELPENRGKAGAFAVGVEACLANSEVAHLVVRDADADHLSSDAPNLYRLARQIEDRLHTRMLVVVGGRTDLYRPMGLERSEYEWLVNDVAWNALAFALAAQARAINTQYWAAYAPYPDLQSGFKLYTRESAAVATAGLAAAHESDPELDIYRWGCELPPVVEIVARGGVLGQVRRMTVEQQPVSAYEGMVRYTTYGTKAAWCLKRLGLPAAAAKQIFDNALLRRPLYRAQACREELLEMRRFTLGELGLDAGSPPDHAMLC